MRHPHFPSIPAVTILPIYTCSHIMSKSTKKQVRNQTLDEKKNLIDVIGFVTTVRKTAQPRTGSKNMISRLINERARALRVTLWGKLGDQLLKMMVIHSGKYTIILTSMSAKYYNGQLGISSCSSTLILDSDKIPTIVAFKSRIIGVDAVEPTVPISVTKSQDGTLEELLALGRDRNEIPALKEFELLISVVDLTHESLLIDQTEQMNGTFEELLRWGRKRKNETPLCFYPPVVTFRCQVEINKIQTKNGWKYLTCASCKCMKGLPINLKKVPTVMLLGSVNPSRGLCNGTRLIITYIGEFVIRAKIVTGSNIGDTALIPRITVTSKQSKWPFIMKKIQFPIKPCYTRTITKSQGNLLNFVILYLSSFVLSHGQIYVALSKVTAPRRLKILMIKESDNEGSLSKKVTRKETFNN